MPPEDKPSSPKPSSLKQIRTFQGDIADALGRHQESLVSLQRREQVRHGSLAQAEADEAKRSAKRNFMLFLGTLVLLVLAAGGGWYSYQTYRTKTAVNPENIPPNRFFPVEKEIEFDTTDLDRAKFLFGMQLDEVRDVSKGKTAQVLLNKKLADNTQGYTTEELFKILKTHAPGNLLRSFSPLFMLGILGENRTLVSAPQPLNIFAFSTTTEDSATSTATTTESESQVGLKTSTFLIIKLSSYENAFAGMLEWEASLAEDIGPIFSTAKYLRDFPSSAVFKDVTTRNKDARVLALDNGEEVLLYSFFDNDLLIFTDSLDTLKTLIDRLNREKLVR